MVRRRFHRVDALLEAEVHEGVATRGFPGIGKGPQRMLKKVERDIPEGASGPEVLAAIVNLHQSLSTSSVRILVNQLTNLKLAKEPGENVETFANKVIDVAKRIEGTGMAPNDFTVLIYKTFQGSSSEYFASEARDLYSKANKQDTTVNKYEEAIIGLKKTYRDLKDQSEWEAVNVYKEVQSLKAEIQVLRSTLAPKTSRRPTSLKTGIVTSRATTVTRRDTSAGIVHRSLMCHRVSPSEPPFQQATYRFTKRVPRKGKPSPNPSTESRANGAPSVRNVYQELKLIPLTNT